MTLYLASIMVVLIVYYALSVSILAAPRPVVSWSPHPESERRLIREFVLGDMEVDEFEQRLEAILHGNPLPPDLAPLPATDAPGSILYYRPIDGTPEWASPPRPVNLTD